jgi:hypothetical protein
MKDKIIEKFYEELDKDIDKLITEELLMSSPNKKYKRQLKYSESFYEHWKKRLKEFARQIEARGYKDGYKDAKIKFA